MAFTFARATRGRAVFAVFASPDEPVRRDQRDAARFRSPRSSRARSSLSTCLLVCSRRACLCKRQRRDCFLHHECLPVFMLLFFTPSFLVSGIPRTAASRRRFHSSTHPPQRCSNDYRDISVTSACGLNAVNFSSAPTTNRFPSPQCDRDARARGRVQGAMSEVGQIPLGSDI